MTQLGNSAQSGSITSDERIRNVLRRHIQRAYDNHVFTRAALAEESGVSVCQIDQIVSRDAAKQRRVAIEDAFNLAYTLGDAVVNGLLATIHYTARRTSDDDAMAPMMIAAVAMQGLSVIANAAADGRIDHMEQPGCRDAADLIIATVKPLSSLGGAA
ncbi:MAG TPA: hypothetical protein VF637_12825 [Sphingomicrobium sp.]|jgi:hypothetical protein